MLEAGIIQGDEIMVENVRFSNVIVVCGMLSVFCYITLICISQLHYINYSTC